MKSTHGATGPCGRFVLWADTAPCWRVCLGEQSEAGFLPHYHPFNWALLCSKQPAQLYVAALLSYLTA